ncbi:uncharacterized protein LOC117144699 isoform X1 [Drosophila mauritiana]|uniref:Uncharacterized protein LOC117144699 isoform X1 n=1 Tax=Drosophila mauritiana TaxID=7226 RepID=A0A6P8KA87_DROMA|nr:uncharacterized protein LOC117144699 isoform X1 [Drosophila mauritiana]XP_033165915.1 uncharacterized protein LOC117144699 isoform X1 [Drosophila mauritiana]
MPNTYSALPRNWSSGESQRQWTSSSRNRTCHPVSMARSTSGHLIFLLLICLINSAAKADGTARNGRLGRHLSTTPLSHLAMESQPTEEQEMVTESPTESPEDVELATTTELPPEEPVFLVNATEFPTRKPMDKVAPTDTLLLRLARRFASGNELWDGLVRDCYLKPDVSCFQKNVFSYLDTALDVQDVNVTQRLKFFKNQVDYQVDKEKEEHSEARAAASAETPIEEVTSALYGKSIKFAMTHDLEVDLPEVMFNGATFRISPRAIEGNGIIAKLELIPKQVVKARLAGAIIQKKIQKFLRSKLVLSFLALLLIIKIIKIKLFWLLPIVIGVGAAKKLLLKFLLFLFPALSHLFKLCSHYQQSYHAPAKYHHHHHLIDHHHTVVPPWHSGEHHSVPEIIYTHPPKGHPSAYLHGAPVHESYGPGFEHFEGAWENSGPGLGSEYIGDINRVAQIEENAHFFKPHPANDAGVLHAWGLGTTQQAQHQTHQPHQRWPVTQQARPPTQLKQQQAQQQTQQHQQQQQLKLQLQQQLSAQKVQASSHSLNPFQSQDKQSSRPAHTQHHPVYVPGQGHHPPQNVPGLTAAAQIAAQYDPARNNQHPQQPPQQANHAVQEPQLSPELAAQLKEAIRIQAEQRLIQQQQKILEHQPFVQDGQPLYPLNYDPFYSPILLKIDKIIEQLGVKNDLCKERIVCSMYKDPATYSPHSNFISAELSRDTSELEPVTHANEAVRRFYRLIQAARDGQDQKDCPSLYPQCNMPAK